MLLLLLLPLAPFVAATFGLIVVNLFSIDGGIFVVNFTVVLLGISVLASVTDGGDGVNVTVGIVVDAVATFDAAAAAAVAGSSLLVLFTSFDTLCIGITAFDVTFSL